MKKAVLTLMFLVSALILGAQEKNAPLSRGFKFSIGAGVKYVTDWKEIDIAPELGFHYRLDTKNMLGVSVMYDCVSNKEHILALYTYDFMNNKNSPFAECRLGVVNFFKKSAGGYLGMRAGWRCMIADKVPFRLGVTMDVDRVPGRLNSGKTTSLSLGIMLRTEL